jgi:tetratricopeptide (TPR) repeat protein
MIFFKRKKKVVHQEDAFDAAVRLGNAANATKEWLEASRHYSKALDIRPSNVAIRIQFGHALKEQRLLAQAEQAYHQASIDDPLDADAYLHLGHASKMLGNKTKAVSAYTNAARLGATSAVGTDARRELSALGVVAIPKIVPIDLSGLGTDHHFELVNALNECRWGWALTVLDSYDAPSSQLRIIRAQIYQILERYDEALSIYSSEAVNTPGGLASKALRLLYLELGDREKAIQSSKAELQNGIEHAMPFSTQADLVGELASMGNLDQVFEAAKSLFASGSDASTRSRTAVDVKRQRISQLFPGKLSSTLRDDFLARSAQLKEVGELPQATLLNDEAHSLGTASKGQ